jgi:hypothetical protein
VCAALNREEIEEMLRRGAYNVLMNQDDERAIRFKEEEVDQILSRSRKLTYGGDAAAAEGAMAAARSGLARPLTRGWRRRAVSVLQGDVPGRRRCVGSRAVPRVPPRATDAVAAEAALDLKDPDFWSAAAAAAERRAGGPAVGCAGVLTRLARSRAGARSGSSRPRSPLRRCAAASHPPPRPLADRSRRPAQLPLKRQRK